jgi:hypothetical protein
MCASIRSVYIVWLLVYISQEYSFQKSITEELLLQCKPNILG